jgi:hypothetical protein
VADNRREDEEEAEEGGEGDDAEDETEARTPRRGRCASGEYVRLRFGF